MSANKGIGVKAKAAKETPADEKPAKPPKAPRSVSSLLEQATNKLSFDEPDGQSEDPQVTKPAPAQVAPAKHISLSGDLTQVLYGKPTSDSIEMCSAGIDLSKQQFNTQQPGGTMPNQSDLRSLQAAMLGK